MKYAGKTVMITGAFRRLGWEMACHFAAHGARLICHYFQSGEDREERVRMLEALGSPAIACMGRDLSDARGLEEEIRDLFAQCGPIHALIHNASIYEDDDIKSADLEALEKSLALHAISPWLLSRVFAEQAPDGATLIAILDAALPRKRGYFTYQMGKSMLVELTRQMARAFAPRVRVHGVALGPFLKSPSEGDLSAWVAGLPIPRWGEVSDLTRALDYLLEATYSTGEVLRLDGGLHVRSA